MAKYLPLVCLVAILLPDVWAIDANCNYYQALEVGQTYYVFNDEYPNNYSAGSRSCRWYAKSTGKIKLTCNTFSLPATSDCQGDRLSISASGDPQMTDARNWCGTGSFSVESTGTALNIVLTTYNYSTGGRFHCSLEAIRPASTNCQCGWKKQIMTRIVGGSTTGINEYPMMAGLVNFLNSLVFCGATIISPRHVLTTARGIVDVEPNQLGVLVGEWDTTTGADTNATRLYSTSHKILHPLYDPDTGLNDIAIVKIEGLIKFSMEVGPACLPFSYGSISFEGSKVDVLGWGAVSFGGEISDILQKVTVDVVPVSRCAKTSPVVEKSQLCTFTPGKDACQFDCGGPLLWKSPMSGSLFSVGIVGYEVGCGSDVPAVNTKVGSYLDWILQVTPGTNYCMMD